MSKSGFWLGVKTYFESFGFILKHRLLHYFLFPIALALLLIFVLAFSLFQMVDVVSEPIFSFFDLESDTPKELWQWETLRYWLANFAQYAAVVIIYIAVIYLYFKLQKYIVLILMAPLMALLSERVDEILTGREFPFSWSQLMSDVWRGILISIRNFAVEMGIVLAVWMVNLGVSLFFSPLAVIMSPLAFVALFLVSAYFYGFSSIDFINERYRLSVSESVKYVKRHRALSVANGMFFHLWMYIPVLGIVFGPVTCTVAASLAVHKIGDISTERAKFITSS